MPLLDNPSKCFSSTTDAVCYGNTNAVNDGQNWLVMYCLAVIFSQMFMLILWVYGERTPYYTTVLYASFNFRWLGGAYCMCLIVTLLVLIFTL